MSEPMIATPEQDTRPLLLFRVADEMFALPLERIEEAIELPALHGVPTRERHLLGVVEWRGELLPVYSPRRVLGTESRSEGIALVVGDGARHVGLVVDDVDDVLELRPAEIRRAPLRGAAEPVLEGLVRHEQALVAVLDAVALVGQCAAVEAT
jgi:purine-binding chemotaxis protein CheW